MKKISYEEALKILGNKRNSSGSQLKMPESLIPDIITNDSFLSYTYRKAFFIDEFKNWCGLDIESDIARDYYISFDHKFDEIKKQGDEIYKYLRGIINNEYSSASMEKGENYDNFTDEYGQTFYTSNPISYNNGWETDIYKNNDNQDLKLTYSWWNDLDENLKTVFSKKLIEHVDYDLHRLFENKGYSDLIAQKELLRFFIPSPSKLNNLINVKKLNLSGLKGKLDISQIECFVKLIELDISYCTNIENLQCLEKLESLDISNTNISTLNFSQNMKNLKNLIISNTNITDLLPLYKLEELEYLDIRGCKLLRTLTPIKNLKRLSIRDSQFNLNDIKKFEDLIGYKIEKIDT